MRLSDDRDRGISSREAAIRLGVTPRRVLQLVHAGRLNAEKVGRDWLIWPEDLAPVMIRKPGRPKR